jgi:surface antigen-like variable number repeat protein
MSRWFFPPEELRKLIPLQAGDLFSAQKIRDGLKAMDDLYGDRGTIDFTGIPFTDVDDFTHQISIGMEWNQRKQFRIGTIDVSGLDPTLASLWESEVKPGDVFHKKIMEKFLAEQRSVFLPLVRHEEIIQRRDPKRGIVDLRFGVPHFTEPDNGSLRLACRVSLIDRATKLEE